MVKTLETTARPMTRLLRRADSLEYFRHTGWTTNAEEAETFGDVVEATRTCVRYGLKDVELVLRTEPKGCVVFCTPIR